MFSVRPHLFITIGVLVGAAAATTAQSIVNASFDEPVAGWALTNDAEMGFAGGPAGWVWETPVVPLDLISDEDVFPTDGDAFGITYAGSDSFTQTVVLPREGVYTFLVDYNGIEGAFNRMTMIDGEFELFAGVNESERTIATHLGGWSTLEWQVGLPAGPIEVGIRNVLSGNYAIAYDNFRIIPAPASTLGLGLAGLLAACRRR